MFKILDKMGRVREGVFCVTRDGTVLELGENGLEIRDGLVALSALGVFDSKGVDICLGDGVVFTGSKVRASGKVVLAIEDDYGDLYKYDKRTKMEVANDKF